MTRVVLVAGSKGGVGRTTVAAGLAFALAREHEVGLLDADLSCPNLPVLLGVSGPPRVLDGKMVPAKASDGPVTVSLMSTGLFGGPDTVFAWQGPLLRGVVRQFVRDVDWGKPDYLVVDVPSGTGPVHAALIDALAPATAVVVTTSDRLALTDTRRCLRFLEDVVPVAAIVENRADAEPATTAAFRIPSAAGDGPPWRDERVCRELARLATHLVSNQGGTNARP
ncbi:ATP-binding protein [Lentzea tibetensis]|uniref:ATP-binding protein n=1 Tax=Lentzea tibetensis TaxID=2591470 RepID=A0A563ERR4_9PSEU|nr:P-loop NTPase [Lentzea tibetensis]TWP50435.1 ATP-binding protein [Lentzea tibetensis]